MNFLLIFIVTAILQFFTPWWTVSVVPFLVFIWRPLPSFRAFLISFIAIALLWFAYGLYLHISSDGAMSNRIAQIFSLPNGILLLLVTALVGGLAGGFSGLAGSLMRQTFTGNT